MKYFALYLFGMLVLVVGLSYAATLAGAPTQWVVAGAITLVGLGIVMAISRTVGRDSPGRK